MAVINFQSTYILLPSCLYGEMNAAMFNRGAERWREGGSEGGGGGGRERERLIVLPPISIPDQSRPEMRTLSDSRPLLGLQGKTGT